MSSKTPENIIVETLKESGVNFFTMLPCEKVKRLYNLISRHFRHISLSREEEGVGICAGAYLAGAKPAMLIQSSGMGNMINALCSLTKTYQLPLLILASWRGIYKEEIPAQIPLGRSLPKILEAIDISFSIVEDPKDVPSIRKAATKAYEDDILYTVLLSPRIWDEEANITHSKNNAPEKRKNFYTAKRQKLKPLKPILTRLEILKVAAPYLEGKIVVCNLGIPCKELYSVKHQKSNFYMLGSMGLASPVGLGISLFTKKDVVVIDGDGSLLMNTGALSTIAMAEPRNLSILAIDNGVHGSTGNQPTATSYCVDLDTVAEGLGFEKIYKAASKEEISSVLEGLGEGPNFVHLVAKPGNAKVPNIPLTPVEIRQNVMEALKNNERM